MSKNQAQTLKRKRTKRRYAAGWNRRELRRLRQAQQALTRTKRRMAKYAAGWDRRSPEELARHHPELGIEILSRFQLEPNKKVFKNVYTGWHLYLDRHGNYSTVKDETGAHVSWDGQRNQGGRGAEFHFLSPEVDLDLFLK